MKVDLKKCSFNLKKAKFNFKFQLLCENSEKNSRNFNIFFLIKISLIYPNNISLPIILKLKEKNQVKKNIKKPTVGWSFLMQDFATGRTIFF